MTSNPTAATAPLWAALREVIDPELGCNIVDLGLIYGLALEGRTALVEITLTTRGCPLHESLRWGVESALLALDAIDEVQVEFVWEPPWTPERMSPAGRAATGIG